MSVKYEYDRNGNNTRTILPSGAEILREYDAVDRLVMERHLDKNSGIDNTTRFAYDKAGNLICITDNQGRETKLEYDLMNREVRRTERDGSVTRQFYDKNGQLVKTIRPKEYDRAGDAGAGVEYTYDAQGNILTVIRADGTVQESNVYDADGMLISTMDGTGGGADFCYDFGGRRTRIETKGKASQRYEYDAMGNITGIIDGVGNYTEYILDKWGRIVEIKQADGSSEFYAYDYAGNMTRSTDGEGNTTTYEYSGINQLAAMTDPEGNQETYVYDAEERLCRKTDRNGVETRYAYNLYGNLLERRAKSPTDATELSECYEYTAEGLLKSAIAQGMRYDYTYDEMDRLQEKHASGRMLLGFAYDRNGNLTRQTDVTGKVTEYRYNLSDQISEVWDNGKQLAAYEYNADGTMKSLRCGTLYLEYAYDTDRNMTGLKAMLGNRMIANNHYRYDGNGNRLEKQQKYGTMTYSYDNMNRLARVEYPNSMAVRQEELFYDKAGNRVKRTCNGMEELYQYDKRNRLTVYTKGGISKEYEYDNAGNLIKDDKAKYGYDTFNRNTKAETFNGNIQINRYDAEGLRHEMEENGKLVSFIFRGTEIVAEETKEDKIRYIRTGELLASDAESARTYYHYASDEMGSITHVVNDTDVLNHYEYDAWGNPVVCEEKVENRFKFNGQQYDPISQQYYLRARYYNPVIGRFIQEDTYRGDGLNLYAYCKNNPVYYVDPSGNYVCPSGVERISNAINERSATRDDVKQISSHLRKKIKNGQDLTPTERNIANQFGMDTSKSGSSSLQDIANKAAQEYNAKYNPYERAISKGYTNVKKTANGGVSFQGSEYMYYHNGQEARKVIQATGNRNNDFKMANQAMGLLETPDGYVWHYLDDYNVEKNTITMELVMDEAHNASKPHSGGCAQYDSVNGPTYNKKKKRR